MTNNFLQLNPDNECLIIASESITAQIRRPL